MVANVLDGLLNSIGRELTGAGSRVLGEPSSMVQSALGSIIPTMLAGLAQKASAPSGASELFRTVTGPGVDTGLLSNFGNVNSDSLISTGRTLLAGLFGNKTGAIDEAIANSSGLRTSEVSRLMAMAAPLVLAFLKKLATTDRLDAGKFANLLVGQKDFLAKSGLDNRIVNALGFSDLRGLVGSLGDSAAGLARGTGAALASAGATSAVAAKSTVRRWWPWILAPIVAALLIAIWMGRESAQTRTPTAARTTLAPATTAPRTAAPRAAAPATVAFPEQIYFDTGSAAINADNSVAITRVATQIAGGAHVALTGYT